MSFVHLHTHTNFSFGDGACRIPELVAAAAGMGMPALAATDHEGLYGAVRFYQACKAAGIKPIVGVELTVEPAVGRRRPCAREPGAEAADAGACGCDRRGCGGVDERRRRGRRGAERSGAPSRAPIPARGAGSLRGAGGFADLAAFTPDGHIRHLTGAATMPPSAANAAGAGGHHLVLLARDYTGWSNLCRIISAAHLEHPGEPPLARLATLAEHGGHLVALSGCRRGEVWSRLLAGDKAGARAAASVFRELFGREFFVELQHELLPDSGASPARPRPAGPRAAPAHRGHQRRALHGQGRRRPARRARRRGRQPAAAQPAGAQERRALPQEPGADAPPLPALPGGVRQRRAHRRALQPRSRPRAAPLPRLPAAARRDRLLAALEALLQRRRGALPAAHRRGHGAPRARAQGRRGARLRRVLPRRARHRRVRARPRHLLLRPRLRRQQHRQLRAAHLRRRPHRARAALRALPQPGAPRDARRGHRLLLGAPRRGHPVHLRALRPRQGRHGRHRQHRARALGGAHRQPRLRLHAGRDQRPLQARALGQRRQARGDARRAPRARRPRVPGPALPPPRARRRAPLGLPGAPRHAPRRLHPLARPAHRPRAAAVGRQGRRGGPVRQGRRRGAGPRQDGHPRPQDALRHRRGRAPHRGAHRREGAAPGSCRATTPRSTSSSARRAPSACSSSRARGSATWPRACRSATSRT